VALISIPSGASAATTIGETFDPSSLGVEGLECSSNFTRLQSVSPGAAYAAPSAGVITRWSFEADPVTTSGDIKFKVARPAPGADFTGDADFTVIGESAFVAPALGELTSYPIRIPVQAGDVIGTYTATGGPCSREQPGYALHYKEDDVLPGTPTTFMRESNIQVDVSAILEPDCDKDGLGDETQDSDLGLCLGLTCKGTPATIVGTPGNDVRSGTPGVDVMVGQGGSDTLSGLAGNDVICGGPGKDKLRGGPGNDFLSGQKGNDKLVGQKGKDKLSGKKGKDVCIGGAGTDKAKGCENTKSI
jgi:hypothetical protein